MSNKPPFRPLKLVEMHGVVKINPDTGSIYRAPTHIRDEFDRADVVEFHAWRATIGHPALEDGEFLFDDLGWFRHDGTYQDPHPDSRQMKVDEWEASREQENAPASGEESVPQS